MNTASLKPGDAVEIDVRGTFFTATVRGKSDGLIRIEPDDSRRHTWRFVTPRQIVRRVQREAA